MAASHSKNPKSEEDSFLIYTLAQLHRVHTKEFLSFCISNTPPLKANLFLSFQTVQKIHNGMDFQIFFLFFPTKEPLQLNNASLTSSGNTHLTPTRARMISQRALTTIQYKKNVIYIFLFTTTQKTAVRKLPTPFLQPIQGENLPPRGFPSKKGLFGWDLVHPNAFIRKGACIGVTASTL